MSSVIDCRQARLTMANEESKMESKMEDRKRQRSSPASASGLSEVVKMSLNPIDFQQRLQLTWLFAAPIFRH
jgi:hypothetical protein